MQNDLFSCLELHGVGELARLEREVGADVRLEVRDALDGGNERLVDGLLVSDLGGINRLGLLCSAKKKLSR